MSAQPLETEGQSPSRKPASAVDKMATTLDGTSISNSFIGQGYAKDDDDLQNSEGGQLTLFRAFQVSFCIAFGAGVALVGWYPKLAGTWGFFFVVVLVSFSGGIAENALHVTAIKTQANSFTELCTMLPNWMSRFTTMSMVCWGFTIAGLYIRYVFTFINLQLLPEESRFDEQGMGSVPLYGAIGFVVYWVTLPPKFSGRVVKLITDVNLATTWVVIVTAIVKGITMVNTTPEENRPPEYEQWKPEGFLQVTVLLAGAMFQCSAVPQLQYEIIPDQRERAAVMIPLLLAVVQGVCFLVIGLIGYWALGDCIGDDGDVFKSYFEVRPDWMVTVMQGGIALLMFLTLPLLCVPPKNELWALMQVGKKPEEKVPFEDSPALARHGLNLLAVGFGSMITPLLGNVLLMNIVTIEAGTFANWLNLFLPSFVTLYANILPSRKAGQPYAASALKFVWILVIAVAALYSSLGEIYVMVLSVIGSPEPPAVIGNSTSADYCDALR